MKSLQEKHMEKIYGNLRVPAQYHLTRPIPPHPPKQRRPLGIINVPLSLNKA